MDISIVIVNWNGGANLQQAVRSALCDLARGNAWVHEMVVVDNASVDGSARELVAQLPAVRLIENQRNVGFAAAANQGLAASSGDLVLFLNPDVKVREGSIVHCANYLAGDERIGIVGCRLLNADLTWQQSVENFHSVPGLLLDNLLSLPLLPRLPISRRRLRFGRPATGDVDWMHGAFFFGRRSVLEDVGGFDPDYFMYGEDMDLCYRVRQAGYRVVYVDEVAVVHIGNASASKFFGNRRGAEILRSTLLFFRKHRGLGGYWVLRLLAGGKFLARALSARLLALLGEREQHAAKAEMYWHMARLCAGLEARGKSR